MTRRSGATLVEVLVTIFVMAIGLIALLTLFPIGAMRMAEAVKDSRTALAAANAEALTIARNLRNDTVIVPANGSHSFFKNPTVIPVGQVHPEDADRDGASYPVYMDPIGTRTYSGNPDYGRWVGGSNTYRIRRVEPSFVNAGGPSVPVRVQRVLGSFSLLDDITFGQNGIPIRASDGQPSTGPNQVQREGRYSWGLMFKRPKLTTPSVVEMAVVVYSGRPMQLSSGAAVQFGEGAYEGRDGAVGGSTVTIRRSGTQERPNIKKGSWILDASWEREGPGRTRYGPVHGHFYRVVNYTETSATDLLLQLERQLKAPINTVIPSSDPPESREGRIIVMDNVVEVFEKGAGWLP